jgi:small subunit ribosomal protein S20
VANHKSAAKRARQEPRRRERNSAVKSRVKTSVKAFEAALESGDAEAAKARLGTAERELRRAASRGVLPRTRVSRKVSRLAKRLAQASS